MGKSLLSSRCRFITVWASAGPLFRERHGVPRPGVFHSRGGVERHDWTRRRGRGRRSVVLSAAAVASGSLARAAPEANEATFAPDVETKNIPQRADADGLKSAMRALGDRRVKRRRPARSRTCTLDALHVCLSHALDARSDALPRRLSLRARRSRAVRRACFFPRETGPMPSSAVRARDVPCDATCRASHDDAHNPSWFRPSRP